MLDELFRKIQFVDELSKAILKVQHNIENIKYKVFRYRKFNLFEEYLVIIYKGGATTVRNCSGNSYSAIFEEISKYLNSGYYSEVEYYEKNILENSNYVEIQLVVGE